MRLSSVKVTTFEAPLGHEVTILVRGIREADPPTPPRHRPARPPKGRR